MASFVLVAAEVAVVVLPVVLLVAAVEAVLVFLQDRALLVVRPSVLLVLFVDVVPLIVLAAMAVQPW
jgi:hypothetical protein